MALLIIAIQHYPHNPMQFEHVLLAYHQLPA